MTTPRLRGGRRLLAVATVAALGSLAAASSALADVTGTGGGAFVASGTLAGNLTAGTVSVPVNISVGPLASVTAPAPPIATSPTTVTNGVLAADLSLASLGIVNAGVGSTSSSTSGATGSLNLGPTGAVTSSASLAGVTGATPLIGGTTFSADAVSSTCTANDSGTTGSTTIVNGMAATGTGGVLAAVTASPAPNTVLNVSFTSGQATITGTITLNEQTVTNSLGTASIIVNAVHIHEVVDVAAHGLVPEATETLDVIIGQSACTVTGPDVNSTVAAQFRSFSARVAKHGVQLNWRTASQIDVAGYNVYRQVRGVRVRINKHLIVAKQSGRYSFFDHARRAGARYWLQTVNLDGSRSWHGPARVVAHRLAV
jgi:hypothetical protein